MQTFEYPLLAKIVYRYANIPVTIILIIYFIASIGAVSESWIWVLSVIAHALLIFFINRYYWRSYKSFPYKIEIDNEKMICSNFFMSQKKVEINLIDIETLRGGIFSNSLTKPIFMKIKNSDSEIGFHFHLKNYNKLLTTILSNINQGLYNSLLEKIKDTTMEKRKLRKEKRNNRVNKKKSR
jgi:energy-coupling factor transporter transmembrane protein EcfT